MERVSIKEAFGNEVTFTKFIAEDVETKNRLLESLGYPMDGEYNIEIESKTIDSKRVDLIIKDDTDEVVNVIESQDSTGWLDTVHSSKISYYCWEKECNFGTLITEDASEHIKNYIKWTNENTPLNITILKSLIYKIGSNNFYVDFFPIMRWIDGKEKKIEAKKPKVELVSTDIHYSKTSEKILSKFIELKKSCENLYNLEFTSKPAYISAKFPGINTNVMYFHFRNSKIIIDMGRGNVLQNGETSKNFFTLDKEYSFVDDINWTWKSGTKGHKYNIAFNESSDIETTINIIEQKINNIKNLTQKS